MSSGDVPERYRHYLRREGLRTVGVRPMAEARATVRRSLPTMEHAAKLFDAVVARLQDRAFVDDMAPNGVDRRLYVRDHARPDWLVALPLLELELVTRLTAPAGAITVVGPDGKVRETKPAPEPAPKRRVDIAPTGPWATSGQLKLRSSAAPYAIGYDASGVFLETIEAGGDSFTWGWLGKTAPCTLDPFARPPQLPPFELLCRDDPPGGAWSIDALAEIVCGFDLAAHTALRVRVPAPVPGGAAASIAHGLQALRGFVYDERGAGAAWVVADAFDGTAIGHGDDADAALTAWQRELFRVRPKPPEEPPTAAPPPQPPPPPPASDEPEGPLELVDVGGKLIGLSTGMMSFSFAGGGRRIPWPAPIPGNTPGVLLPLGPAPGPVPSGFAAAGFTRWARVVGAFGRVAHVLVRRDARGTVMVGDGILDVVDPASLDGELDAVLAAERASQKRNVETLPGFTDPFAQFASGAVVLSVFDEARRAKTEPRLLSATYPGEVDPRQLDGDILGWHILWSFPTGAAA